MQPALLIILLINIVLLFLMYYFQRKYVHTYILWTLIILAFPIVGFIFYLIFGQGCRFIQQKSGKRKQFEDKTYLDFYNQDGNFYSNYKLPNNVPALAKYNFNQGNAYYTQRNKVDLYANNKEFFESFLKDIENAQDSIRLEIYSFKSDEFGNRMRELLISKAKSGVEVSILYDALGSRKSSKLFFTALSLAGATVRRFNRKYLKSLSFSNSHRNKRNIFLLDGKIAYVGSVRLSNESNNANEKYSNWHDSVVRISGEAVNYCTTRFYQDFNYASGKYHKLTLQTFNEDLPHSAVQVAFDGPDTKNYSILGAIIKAIYEAKSRIIIVTNSFIPNSNLMQAIRIAKKSGVRVQFVIGKMSQSPIKFCLTKINLSKLMKFGVEVYQYNGYINDKAVVIDDNMACIGNVELDANSLWNNFNLTAFMYDTVTVKKQIEIYQKLIDNCAECKVPYLATLNVWNRFWARVLQWLNPII